MECPTCNGWTNFGSLIRRLCYRSSMAELMSKVNVCLGTYLSYLPTYLCKSLPHLTEACTREVNQVGSQCGITNIQPHRIRSSAEMRGSCRDVVGLAESCPRRSDKVAEHDDFIETGCLIKPVLAQPLYDLGRQSWVKKMLEHCLMAR
ncbi:hypothetical protein FVEG_17005 [Fusarium verticillioides 7600]|uniref:Uncharacterized protein n=1 Tax=Gibberella moniliformis (strain M3125 / FGSC 7600) TaxID=334819 RepID=W7MXV1_GIBM7|nr:hypothetical protein FVEG_17005 [Fusarium verticillioides 7600]EWG52669.1 hypothetical protein FVEG_17005 [Fusarium verticillioides 7600]